MAKKTGVFSIYGISVAGAACHSIGQVAMITWIYRQYFMQLYAPLLVGLSVFSGLVVGALAANVIKRIEGRSVMYG
jgi:heptaprenyl diphosphate synthase